MKKSLLIAVIALVCGTMAYAQPRAIGARLGMNDDFVYQHSLSDKTFIELKIQPLINRPQKAGVIDWASIDAV